MSVGAAGDCMQSWGSRGCLSSPSSSGSGIAVRLSAPSMAGMLLRRAGAAARLCPSAWRSNVSGAPFFAGCLTPMLVCSYRLLVLLYSFPVANRVPMSSDNVERWNLTLWPHVSDMPFSKQFWIHGTCSIVILITFLLSKIVLQGSCGLDEFVSSTC